MCYTHVFSQELLSLYVYTAYLLRHKKQSGPEQVFSWLLLMSESYHRHIDSLQIYVYTFNHCNFLILQINKY